MEVSNRNGISKFCYRRQRKLDNLFRQKPYLKNNITFNYIRTRFSEIADQQFKQFTSEHYEQLKANVKYVQWCSGLNVQEFCAVFNLGHAIISLQENKYSHNIRQHTFLKIYSAFLIYLPSIEFKITPLSQLTCTQTTGSMFRPASCLASMTVIHT